MTLNPFRRTRVQLRVVSLRAATTEVYAVFRTRDGMIARRVNHWGTVVNPGERSHTGLIDCGTEGDIHIAREMGKLWAYRPADDLQGAVIDETYCEHRICSSTPIPAVRAAASSR